MTTNTQAIKREALRQAWDNFRKAKNASDALVQANTAAQIEQAWQDFLMAAGTIFNKLNAGTRKSQRGCTWYSTVGTDRQKDELLQYLKVARNSLEHGAVRIVKPHDASVRVDDGGVMFSGSTDSNGHLSIGVHYRHGANSELKIEPPCVELIPVTDKGGQTVPVPTMHFGKRILQPTPQDIAALAMPYLERILRDAKTLL